MPEVIVVIEDKRWHRSLPKAEAWVRKVAMLALQKKKNASVAIVLTNDKHMQELNHTYRSKNRPTNVLAFPGDEELGDVVLGLETIRQEAAEQKKTFKQHVGHMVTHGCLHLLGYDHMSTKDATVMEALEIALLKQLRIPNPYAQ